MLEPIDRTIAVQLRKARLLRGMTQAELAGQIGCSFQQLQKYEAMQNRISASRLFHLSLALHVPISYFYDQESANDTEESFDSTVTRVVQAMSRIPQPEVREMVAKMVQSLTETQNGAAQDNKAS